MRIQWADLKTFDIIGSGSFGRVFHGDLLGTEVAIKECVRSESKAFDEKYFKREVDILKQSRHPNIVQVRLYLSPLPVASFKRRTHTLSKRV